MSKKLFFSFVLLCWSLSTLAQITADITVGKPYDVIDSGIKHYFIQGNNIVTVKIEKKKLILQKLNAATLALESVKEYEDFPKNSLIEKITQFKNSYYVFYSWYNNYTEHLLAREIDITTGQFKGEGKNIISFSEKLAGSIGKNGFFGVEVYDKYNFFYSYDSSKLMVQYRQKPAKKLDSKNYDIIGSTVFSEDLTPQWEGEFTMPYTEKKMNILDYSVDSHGNVYMVVKVYKDNSTDERKRGKDEANYALELFKFSAPSGELTKTNVALADKFIHTLWMYEDSKKENMVCTGFYNSGDVSENADGILMFKLGSDGKYFDMTTHPIPIDVLNLNAGKKAIRKNERKEDDDRAEFEDLRFLEARIQKDGSILLISEQQYEIRHTTTSGQGRTSSYMSYHRDNILVTKIEANGTLAWMKKLPKRQRGASPGGGMSFKYIPGDGVHNFIFLDNEKNKVLNTIDIPDQYYDPKNGYLTSFTIDDKTGTVKKTYLVDLRNVKGIEVYQFLTTRIMPYGNNTFIFEAYKKGKEDVLVKVQVRK